MLESVIYVKDYIPSLRTLLDCPPQLRGQISLKFRSPEAEHLELLGTISYIWYEKVTGEGREGRATHSAQQLNLIWEEVVFNHRMWMRFWRMDIELQEVENMFLAKGRKSGVFKMCFGLRWVPTVNKMESVKGQDGKAGRRRNRIFGFLFFCNYFLVALAQVGVIGENQIQ